MLTPNSNGERLQEIGWTDEARAASLATRRANAKHEEDTGQGLTFNFKTTGRLQAAVLEGTVVAKHPEGGHDPAGVMDSDRETAKAAVAKALGKKLFDPADPRGRHMEQVIAFARASRICSRSCVFYNQTLEDIQAREREGGQARNDQIAQLSRLARDVSEEVASHLVSLWAGTSGDHEPGSIALQARAEKIFNLTETYSAFGVSTPDTAEMKNAAHNLGKTPEQFKVDVVARMMSYKSSQDALREQVKSLVLNHAPVFDRFLRAQYDETQAYLKAHGITEVTVYRGMIVPAKRAAPFEQGAFASARLQPLSSFSTSFGAAASFSLPGDMGGKGVGRAGLVMAVHVPASKILSTPRTGVGCLSEGEVVVLGGRYPAFVNARHYREGRRSRISLAEQTVLDRLRRTQAKVYLPSLKSSPHLTFGKVGGPAPKPVDKPLTWSDMMD